MIFLLYACFVGVGLFTGFLFVRLLEYPPVVTQALKRGAEIRERIREPVLRKLGRFDFGFNRSCTDEGANVFFVKDGFYVEPQTFDRYLFFEKSRFEVSYEKSFYRDSMDINIVEIGSGSHLYIPAYVRKEFVEALLNKQD